MPHSRQHQALATGILAWYDRNRRDLPWRAGPGERADPYRVWLSEIMLQQTTTTAAGRYFLAFVTRWPSLAALARSPLEDVLRAWAGLGYYARARNLHACARAVVAQHGGVFPEDAATLAKLPGIGRYTAGAIAAIAFDKPVAAVDGNVERVVTRLYALETPLPDVKTEIWQRAQALVPRDRPGDFLQSLMDLGAMICTPRRPDCGACPWHEACQARRGGAPDRLPHKRPRPTKPRRHGDCFVVERQDGAVLMHRRPERGLLGGMLAFPSTEWALAPQTMPLAEAPCVAAWHRVPGQVEHSFTHFHLVLTVHRASVAEPAIASQGEAIWVNQEDLAKEALPSIMRKVAAHALQPQPLRKPASRARSGALGGAGRRG